MRRRAFIAGLGGATAWPLAARAQSAPQAPLTHRASIPEVGFLYPDTTEASKPRIAWTLYSLESLPFAMFRVSHRLR